MNAITKNTLFYGDNLPILREHIPDESIDLVYLDPPFNSNRSYNVLFREEGGLESEAQIAAFDDSWHWDKSASFTYHEIIQNAPVNVASMIGALHGFVGENQMMAYLVMMTARLVELHRVLKPTGSLYLHCDPTASHYLKVILDTIFSAKNFQNEIAWRRSQTRSSISKIYRRAHDIIFFYSKSVEYFYNMQYKELSATSKRLYENEDDQGFYQSVPLLVSGKRNGKTGNVWNGIDPNSHGKAGMHWVTIPEKLDIYEKQGLILWPQKTGGLPRLKYYLRDSPGVPLTDFWDDIDLISSSSSESLGYPTQKPEELLERIIQASSNPGDIVLDPFCGCGTAIAAAQKLNRHWIGIDITHLAIALQKYRLKDAFSIEAKKDYDVIGEPMDLQSAEQLANDDRYQFQWWALSLVGAKPLGGNQESKKGKKGSDRGIDGAINFIDEARENPKTILVQVKNGKVKSGDVRDLHGTVDRENAPIGVFITLEPPTKEMEKEALSAGYYTSEFWQKNYPKIQLLTIEQLLNGAQVDMPAASGTFKKAERVKKNEGTQRQLGI